MRSLLLGLCSLLLISCEQPATNTEKVVVTPPVTTPTSSMPSAATEVSSPEYWEAPVSSDTLITLQGKHYHLHIQAALDSTKHLIVSDKITTKPEDKARGYDGRITLTLKDSLHRQLFRRQFRKADFFKRVGEEVVVPSGMGVPTLLGYNAPLGALVFTIGFAVPDTDWGAEVIVLLNLKGNVLRMSDGNNYGGGADCLPGLSGDGRALLTTSEVIRAHQPAIPLEKPHADLRGAFFFNDTVLVKLYQLGDYKRVRTPAGNWEEQFVTSKGQQAAPNGFVQNLNNGQILSQFHYDGYYEELGYIVPGYQLAATKTLYLLNAEKGLVALASQALGQPAAMPFSAMTKFTPPQRSTEVRFEQQGLEKQYAFYVDTLAPKHIRYQVLFSN